MSRTNSITSVKLEQLRRRASEMPWTGKGGLTDYDVYRSVIEVAKEHGSVCEDGIRVNIA
jgi:hypothetical protein